MASISQSTWKVLGLGVAASWAGLGLMGIFAPARSAEIFGISTSKNGGTKANETGAAFLLGSRDLTIAATLFVLDGTGKHDEMGTVILSSMIICAVDVYLVWRGKRYLEFVTFGIGSFIWGAIGLGLKGYFD